MVAVTRSTCISISTPLAREKISIIYYLLSIIYYLNNKNIRTFATIGKRAVRFLFIEFAVCLEKTSGGCFIRSVLRVILHAGSAAALFIFFAAAARAGVVNADFIAL